MTTGLMIALIWLGILVLCAVLTRRFPGDKSRDRECARIFFPDDIYPDHSRAVRSRRSQLGRVACARRVVGEPDAPADPTTLRGPAGSRTDLQTPVPVEVAGGGGAVTAHYETEAKLAGLGRGFARYRPSLDRLQCKRWTPANLEAQLRQASPALLPPG
jgi:hypothetical protein